MGSGVVIKNGLLESDTLSVSIRSLTSVQTVVKEARTWPGILIICFAAFLALSDFFATSNFSVGGLVIAICIGGGGVALLGMQKDRYRLVISVSGREQIAYESADRTEIEELRNQIREAMSVT